MLTIKQAIALGRQTLAAVPDPEVDAVVLLSDVTGTQPMVLRLNAQQALTNEQEERYRSLLLFRARRQPLQYLLGKQWFYGRPFTVDSRVLIPRQETETLCEAAITFVRNAGENPRVLDLCTGSGAIAVTLKLECPGACVTAADLSVGALNVARGNARLNQADVRFVQGDLLTPVQDEHFALIACNPPYVTSAACETLQPEVRFEPRMALDGGTDGLEFYRRLAAEAPACLTEGGRLMLEIGDGQAAEVAALLERTHAFADVTVLRDLYGSERVVTARHLESPT